MSERESPQKLAKIGIGKAASVTVHHHWLRERDGDIPCWTYVSAGLSVLGQKEVALTIKREADEDRNGFPREAVSLFELLYDFSKRRQFVDIGGITQLAPQSDGLLGRANFRGIAYAPGVDFDGIPSPTPHLTAVLLTDQEFAAAMDCGMVRMLSLLGERYRWFPFAPWADRRRPNLVTVTEMESSLIARMGRIRVPGLRTYVLGSVLHGSFLERVGHLVDTNLQFRDQRFVIEVPISAREMLAALPSQLGGEVPLAIVSTPDPRADACLWWRPGIDVGEARAIGPTGTLASHVSTNHFCFNPKQERDAAGYLEGGIGFNLRTESWRAILGALARTEPFGLELAQQETRLDICWVEENVVR